MTDSNEEVGKTVTPPLAMEADPRLRDIRERISRICIPRDRQDIPQNDVEWAYENTIFDLGNDIEYLLSVIDSAPPLAQWQDIETAPKDGSRVLLLRGTRLICGEWRMDRGEPYWTHDAERIYGTKDARKNPPTHWARLPDPLVSGG